MKTSAFTILSEPERYCYPYLEAIQSFLPAVDELIVVLNPYKEDGAREKLEKLPVRIVPGYFDLYNLGWVSYAIMRTTGYQACTGEIVAMFDADGVLHERDISTLKSKMLDLRNSDHQNAYWNKYRFYQPETYWDQYKHSGVYDKAKLGDNFDFYHPSGKGIPHFFDDKPAMNMGIWLYGYEHVWDTEEVIRERSTNYGRMQARQHGREVKEDYFDEYVNELMKDLKAKSKQMPIEKQPAIIQDKLRGVNETHFGFNFFNHAR